MPKIKTNRSAAKRFKITKKGKVKKKQAGRSHILTKKSRDRKRRLRKGNLLTATESRMIRKIMPYA